MDLTSQELVIFENYLQGENYQKFKQSHHLEDYGWYKRFTEKNSMIYFAVYDWRKYADRDESCANRISISFNAHLSNDNYERFEILSMPIKKDDLTQMIINFEKHIFNMNK